jgi:threonine aldolase
VLTALPKPVWDGLVADGYSFSRRGAPRDGVVRIACSWDTPAEAVDALIDSAHRHAGLVPAGAASARRA